MKLINIKFLLYFIILFIKTNKLFMVPYIIINIINNDNKIIKIILWSRLYIGIFEFNIKTIIFNNIMIVLLCNINNLLIWYNKIILYITLYNKYKQAIFNSNVYNNNLLNSNISQYIKAINIIVNIVNLIKELYIYIIKILYYVFFINFFNNNIIKINNILENNYVLINIEKSFDLMKNYIINILYINYILTIHNIINLINKLRYNELKDLLDNN